MNQKTAPATAERPLSPHLTVYRPQITSMLSITHRITGFALAVGTLALVSWLWAAAYSIHCFEALSAFFNMTLGRIMLFGWSAAFYFHLCNGIRHLFWDIGKGFEIPAAYRSAYIVLIATVILTAITWAMLLSMGGGQ